MCGRFVSSSPPDELARYFGAAPPESPLRGELQRGAPSRRLRRRDDGTERGASTPSAGGWCRVGQGPSVGNRMINARAETVADQQHFRRPFARHRCIVPADGFYEWTECPGAEKQPYFIHRPTASRWPSPACGRSGGPRRRRDPRPSCTIITTAANEAVATLHDRMPVILPPSAWDAWLDPANHDVEALGRLLVPAPPDL